jgi:DNA-binding protein H-NS
MTSSQLRTLRAVWAAKRAQTAAEQVRSTEAALKDHLEMLRREGVTAQAESSQDLLAMLRLLQSEAPEKVKTLLEARL